LVYIGATKVEISDLEYQRKVILRITLSEIGIRQYDCAFRVKSPFHFHLVVDKKEMTIV